MKSKSFTHSEHPRRAARQDRLPGVEYLENRLLLATTDGGIDDPICEQFGGCGDPPNDPPLPAAFAVNSQLDAVDANPGDGVCETVPGNAVCSLRAAIQEANTLVTEDSITLPAGTYVLTLDGADEDNAATGDLDVTGSLTISGAGMATVIEGNHLDRVLDVQPGAFVNISALTIQHGEVAGSGGGIRHRGVSLSLSDVTLAMNSAGDSGGGLLNAGQSVVVSGSTISGNTAQTGGGGIENTGSEPPFVGFLTISNSTISGNSTAGDGGGIRVNGGSVNLGFVTIVGNSALGGAGGIQHNASFGGVVVFDSIIANSPAGNNCAGAIVSLGNILISDAG